jgi:hypothetical protein
VQHERETLGRRQRVEHHQQRHADRVGEQRFLLGIGPALGAGSRLGQPCLERVLAPRLALAQHVQADPGHHRGQPAAEVLDAAGVSAADAQPGLLQGVVGLADRAEHPVGHGPQPGPVLLEAVEQRCVLVHRSHSSLAGRHRSRPPKTY